MATSFDKIIDIALITINDYALTNLYKKDEEGFKNFCDGILISATPNFVQCYKPLDYNYENREFISDLSTIEISILADLWAIAWMTRKVEDSAQFQAKLQNSGSFKNHSEAQNLKEKTSWLDRMRERLRQKIVDYQLENLSNIKF